MFNELILSLQFLAANEVVASMLLRKINLYNYTHNQKKTKNVIKNIQQARFNMRVNVTAEQRDERLGCRYYRGIAADTHADKLVNGRSHSCDADR